MQFYEFEGKNQEEALNIAMKTLNATKEEIGYEVLEPGSAGIFGIVGGRKAKIKVWLKKEEEDERKKELPLKIAKIMTETILSMISKGKVEVTAEMTDSSISLNATGGDAGVLIGKNGQTLDALQYLLNKMVNKQLEKKVLVVLDIESYRKRKRESLIELAKRMAEKAKKLRKPVSTNPLTARDRRIIHLALKEDKQLETKSKGEGLLKKVVIYPKLRANTRRQNNQRP